jgi:hypothetical protein
MSTQSGEAAELQNIVKTWQAEAFESETVGKRLRSDQASVNNVIGLLSAVCDVANAINGDLLALQHYTEAISITGMPRSGSEPTALKHEIAALETARRQLEDTRAKTQHKLDTAESTINMKLACAQARLREMI